MNLARWMTALGGRDNDGWTDQPCSWFQSTKGNENTNTQSPLRYSQFTDIGASPVAKAMPTELEIKTTAHTWPWGPAPMHKHFPVQRDEPEWSVPHSRSLCDFCGQIWRRLVDEEFEILGKKYSIQVHPLSFWASRCHSMYEKITGYHMYKSKLESFTFGWQPNASQHPRKALGSKVQGQCF